MIYMSLVLSDWDMLNWMWFFVIAAFDIVVELLSQDQTRSDTILNFKEKIEYDE